MAASKFDFVIAGAGVAALASARYIARAAPTSRIALVTPHAPMSLTSSLSTECFRDHWPSPSMRAFMARSISLIEEQARGGAFRVTPYGYLYCSSQPGVAYTSAPRAGGDAEEKGAHPAAAAAAAVRSSRTPAPPPWHARASAAKAAAAPGWEEQYR